MTSDPHIKDPHPRDPETQQLAEKERDYGIPDDNFLTAGTEQSVCGAGTAQPVHRGVESETQNIFLLYEKTYYFCK